MASLCVLFFTLIFTFTLTNAATTCPVWTYPAQDTWSTLCSKYSTCGTGQQQSPINILNTTSYNIGALSMTDSGYMEMNLENTGHFIEAHVVDTAPIYSVSGGPLFSDQYQVVNFHWHSPSEHEINGQRFPLEMHIVHRHMSTGDVAVLSILFDDQTSTPNAWLDSIWYNLSSLAISTPGTTPEYSINVDPYGLVKTFKQPLNYWHYKGSFTTPPCTEGVYWLILQQTAHASPDQIANYYSIDGYTSRYIQPLNGRTIWNVQGQYPNNENEESHQTSMNFYFEGMIPAQT